MFLSFLGQNGAKTKTRSEAVLEARDARKARAEARAPEFAWTVFPPGGKNMTKLK